jgi:hypothetical protein
VAHSVRRRVTALSEAAQEVLGIAAVMGRLAPHGLLVAVAARPEDEVVAALDAACRARLLAEAPEQHAYRFTHDVIREVIEADLGVARRTVLHRQIGAMLEQATPRHRPRKWPITMRRPPTTGGRRIGWSGQGITRRRCIRRPEPSTTIQRPGNAWWSRGALPWLSPASMRSWAPC